MSMLRKVFVRRRRRAEEEEKEEEEEEEEEEEKKKKKHTHPYITYTKMFVILRPTDSI